MLVTSCRQDLVFFKLKPQITLKDSCWKRTRPRYFLYFKIAVYWFFVWCIKNEAQWPKKIQFLIFLWMMWGLQFSKMIPLRLLEIRLDSTGKTSSKYCRVLFYDTIFALLTKRSRLLEHYKGNVMTGMSNLFL